MGLPLEQWRGDEAAAEGGEKEQAAGCRTPRRAQATAASGAGPAIMACPPAPRKRRPVAASAAGAVAQRREFYAGADLEAFFAAHNL